MGDTQVETKEASHVDSQWSPFQAKRRAIAKALEQAHTWNVRISKDRQNEQEDKTLCLFCIILGIWN
jgi:hypothetical protein